MNKTVTLNNSKQQTYHDILETIKILPEEIVNKIFFYVNVPHPMCKVFTDYCKPLNLNIAVPAYDDWPTWQNNPLRQHSVRSFYRDKTYFRFYNVYRQVQIQRRDLNNKRKKSRRQRLRRLENLRVNNSSFI